MTMTAAPPRPPGPRPWWETRPFIALLILISMVPLLYPPVPPLVDLLGHMGRYRVQLDLGDSPWLSQYYEFHWAAIGNLGVDLLVQLLAPIFGLELAVKLIILAIPPMTVAGFLWVAREVHNRIPPTAIFALPLAYSHPFLFGFVNFSLSMALAFLAFGLWLRLGRLGKTRLRAALFVPISVFIFITHTFGWGTLGMLCFSAEAVRQHDRGANWFRAGYRAALHASSLALPIVFMLVWRSDAPPGQTADWFNWEAKFQWLKMIFRDRWKNWDLISAAILVAVMVECIRNPRLGFSRNLGFSALVMFLVFIMLPRIIFGSAYADMRLTPFLFALVLLAIRFRSDTHKRTANVLAVLGMAFYLARIATTTASFAMAANDHRNKLEALNYVPMGAKVASLVGQGCVDWWSMPRNSHLGAMVIVRRQGFSNDQWDIAGTNLMNIRYDAGAFSSDPTEIVRPSRCRIARKWRIVNNRLRGDWKIDTALKNLPRDKFDYVWIVDVAPYDMKLVSGMTPVWKGSRSMLYRIDK
ncbi:hypothetical protein GCM10023264_16150 [Sphingomonas daechungensis]|uniref:hypothetical protein n=1 Tax=Sphingomonas daechungensis TaxID=1176646 RepID=UPI0031E783AD